MTVYADLKVPVGKSTHSSALVERRKLLLQLREYGYGIVALNATVFNSVSKAHRCELQPVPLAAQEKSTGKRQREPQQPEATQGASVQQLTRITVVCETAADAHNLVLGSDALQSYDLVAGQPMSSAAFAELCLTAEVDIISIDSGSRINFHIARKHTDAALKRGLFFEVCYGQAIRNPNARRYMISNTQQLIEATQGRNMLLSGGLDGVMQARAPLDVANLGQVMGLKQSDAVAAVGKSAAAMLLKAAARRARYRGISLTRPASTWTAATAGLPAAAAAAAVSIVSDLVVPAEFYSPPAAAGSASTSRKTAARNTAAAAAAAAAGGAAQLEAATERAAAAAAGTAAAAFTALAPASSSSAAAAAVAPATVSASVPAAAAAAAAAQVDAGSGFMGFDNLSEDEGDS